MYFRRNWHFFVHCLILDRFSPHLIWIVFLLLLLLFESDWGDCAIQGVPVCPAVFHLCSSCSTCASECCTVIWWSVRTKSSWTGQWGKYKLEECNSLISHDNNVHVTGDNGRLSQYFPCELCYIWTLLHMTLNFPITFTRCQQSSRIVIFQADVFMLAVVVMQMFVL